MVDEPTGGRKRVTAQRIERDAVELVLERGFDNVTVDTICERSGISQRTFFNHFKTKDAALLGSAVPRVDERRVREFLASDGPLLAGTLTLVSVADENADPTLFADRLEVVRRTPALFHRQMESLLGIEAEIAEVIYLRLRRTASADESDDETREQAGIATAIAAGVFRFVAERSLRGAPEDAPAEVMRATRLLERVLPRIIE